MFEFNYKVQETGHIPRPVALDNLLGSSSIFFMCVPYVHMVHLHSAWKLTPQGLIPLHFF